ncbi:DUF6152 family protein [Mangrovibrevibacter kandeliae]|uniref:DUF6152 family protein n=1 Tax=Mangrovibrevibacter kandeliae TaxID=2968473 RepID=UPI00211867B2|nr:MULTISPECIES: DUF6152 family protein [unclassified Aurantimonas]MCQ8782409.1 DUF6152 family protein [Aurantimonas sp. CSK15Z-1]MCW4117100.1 DUF6152 family protein [Aurantimonas sp. MSK8Z-1]
MPSKRRSFTAAFVFAALALPGLALAHHGWAWTEDQESRLAGTIEAISFANPHGHIQLRNTAGLWEVDLAPPYANSRAGFVEGAAAPGDEARLTGHRSRDPSELRFKAETITVRGKTYDVYPNREKSLGPA